MYPKRMERGVGEEKAQKKRVLSEARDARHGSLCVLATVVCHIPAEPVLETRLW